MQDLQTDAKRLRAARRSARSLLKKRHALPPDHAPLVVCRDAKRDPPVQLCGTRDPYRNVFDAINDAVFVLDPGTGRFIDLNEPACAMFGYRKDEVIGNDIGLLSSGAVSYTLEAGIEMSVKACLEGPQTFEWECKTKDGTLFWAEVSKRYTEIGNIPVVVSIVRDVTERKRMDAQLHMALDKAFAANAARSAFLANMSHELRTPLNAIIGFSDLMLTQLLGPLGNPRYREYTHDIHKSGLQLLSLIDDLLDLSRIDAGYVNLVEEPINLCRVLTDARRMFDVQASRSKPKIVIEMPKDLPDLRGDARRIKQIVLNLMSNAIKFTPAEGTVTVEARLTEEAMLLEVRDTGIGIKEADMPRVMERFGQVEDDPYTKHQGTGLGLPLVKQLIELHGGSLTIESQIGVGTTVTVAFPLSRVVAAVSAAA